MAANSRGQVSGRGDDVAASVCYPVAENECVCGASTLDDCRGMKSAAQGQEWPIAPSKYDGSIVSVKVFQVRYGFAWAVWRGDGTEPGSLLGAAGSYSDFDRAWDDARECFAKQVAK